MNDWDENTKLSKNFTVHEFIKSQTAKRKEIDNSIQDENCLLYTSPSPRDRTRYRMPSSA